jgi:hypothetical protein
MTLIMISLSFIVFGQCFSKAATGLCFNGTVAEDYPIDVERQTTIMASVDRGSKYWSLFS